MKYDRRCVYPREHSISLWEDHRGAVQCGYCGNWRKRPYSTFGHQQQLERIGSMDAYEPRWRLMQLTTTLQHLATGNYAGVHTIDEEYQPMVDEIVFRLKGNIE